MAGKFEEAQSALRTYAITLRRDANSMDETARELAVVAGDRIQAAKAKRAEADQYDAAAAALETSEVSIVSPADLSSIAENVRKEATRAAANAHAVTQARRR